MAIDAALMDWCRASGEGVVRVYGWSRPTVSFGRNESVVGRYDPGAIAAAGCEVVRRPTGGRALMHDGEVTYAVVAPLARGARLRAAFDDVNTILADALGDLGVVGVAPAAHPAAPLRPHGAACFAEPSAGELTVAGRKLVASAQRADDGIALQHGSIIVEDRQARLAAFAANTGGGVATMPAATLQALVPALPWAQAVSGALSASVGRRFGALQTLDLALLEPFMARHRARYADSEWTWRR